MANSGFAEDKGAPYVAPQDLIMQIRRLGPDGPAYEIVDLDERAGSVTIEVIHSGEKLTYSIAEVLKDPMAETVP